MVRTDSVSDPRVGRGCSPPTFVEVASSGHALGARPPGHPGKHGCRRESTKNPPGESSRRTVLSMPFRSSMSEAPKLQTMPSNLLPANKSESHISATSQWISLARICRRLVKLGRLTARRRMTALGFPILELCAQVQGARWRRPLPASGGVGDQSGPRPTAVRRHRCTVRSPTPSRRRAAALIVMARVPATASVIEPNPAALTFASEASRRA